MKREELFNWAKRHGLDRFPGELGAMIYDAHELVEQSKEDLDTPPAAQPAPVSGVVIRDGLPTLLRDSDIKSTDQRLCVISPATQPEPVQEPSPGGILFAVEQAIDNGDCPFAIEIAFDAYEAERRALAGITKGQK